MTKEEQQRIQRLMKSIAEEKNISVDVYRKKVENTIWEIMVEGKESDIKWVFDMVPREGLLPTPEEVLLFAIQIAPVVLEQEKRKGLIQ